ncbi:hypothetical protein [Streptomyces sp. NPDC059176]|uniref:hypothetical protein n=1 Tax=unclassified Streptomyces TaxID=2593676 RepID=UPI0036B2D529
MRGARAAATAGALVCVGACVWAVWLLFGTRLTAVTGAGPPDGTVTVTECFDSYDHEGSLLGVDCEGAYTAAGSPAHPEDVVLRGAESSYPAGTRVEVRLAGGMAFEPSAVEFVKYATYATILVFPGVVGGLWLSALARRGSAPAPDRYVLLLFAGAVGVLVVGLGLQFVVSAVVSFY